MLGGILLSPVKGLAFVLNNIAKAVDDARDAERRAVMAELQNLHRQLERGEIDDDAFDDREAALLDRLDALSGGGEGA